MTRTQRYALVNAMLKNAFTFRAYSIISGGPMYAVELDQFEQQHPEFFDEFLSDDSRYQTLREWRRINGAIRTTGATSDR